MRLERWFYTIPLRLRSLLRPRQVEEELDEEIQFHLAQRIAAEVASGKTPEDAGYAALRAMQGMEQRKEECRDTRKVAFFADLIRDLQYGCRMLRRQPGFSFLAILCLALGIGATTAVFSWVEGILIRPFPLVAGQERMVAITGTDITNGRDDVSWPDFVDLRKNSTLAQAFIAEHIFGTTLTIGRRAEHATASIVSANYFQALGIRPILGRAFDASDEIGRNAHPVTVISYQCWRDRYSGAPSIIGKTQRLNGVRHTIIGVAPPGFLGTFVGYSFQFWVPASMEQLFEAGGYKLENRAARWVEGFALLKPGVTIKQAQWEMSAIAKRLETQFPATNRGRGIKLYPLWQTPFNGAGTLLPTLRISLIVAVAVLLIACANVGNLLLFRSFARTQEMAVRLALGGSRRRLLKQLLTEGLLLAGVAACAGVALAYASRNLIVLLFPAYPGLIVNLPAQLDWRVLILTSGVCVISSLLFAFAPAIKSTDIDLAGSMKSDSGGALGGRGSAWMRSTLVIVQVSLSFILLFTAGLLLKSVQAMQNSDPGFSTDHVLTTGVDMIAAGYDPTRIKGFQKMLLDRIQGIPGIESAAFTRVTPISYKSYSSAPITVEGFETQSGPEPVIEYDEVGPGFLATMGIRLISGREFTPADNEVARPVAVINQTMLRKFWGNKDAVGKRFLANGKWLQVIGVARDSKYQSLLETAKPFFYTPMLQSTLGQVLQIRSALPVTAVAKLLTGEVKALDPNLAPAEVITMREQLYRMNWSKRATVTLLLIFGGVALLLAGIGLYGLMSYSVSQSTRTLGLRMALGADGPDLLRLVIRQGLVLTMCGILVGSAVALVSTRLLGYLLYEVSPRDPATFALALGVMIFVSLVASVVPARHAMLTDPVKALRS
jgi:predicted permease